MLKSESYKRGLFFSTLLNVVAKGIGFLNSLVLAYFFGTNISTDIYFYVLSVAALITNTINGIDYLVLIPEAMKLREKEGEESSQQFLNFFVWVYAAIGLVISILILASPILFFTFFSKFDTAHLQHNQQLLNIGCILIFFQLLNNFLNAILVSYKYFTVPIVSGLINSVLAITLTIVFHSSIGIAGTMMGIGLGYVLNFLLLAFILKRSKHWHFFKLRLVKSKKVWKNIGLMQLNILPVWIRNYIAIYLISGLGSGIITSMNLGQILASLPEVFILTQVASVVGIKFAELSARDNFTETSKLLTNILNSLFIVLVPMAIIMAVSNKEIIELAFQRGGFNANSTTVTAFCFFYFALLLPSKIYDLVFTRLFTSFQVYGLSTLIAVIGHFSITIITYFAITHFQLTGFFVSQIIGYYLVMPVLFYVILKLRFKRMEIRNITKNFLLMLLLLPLVYLLCYFIYPFLQINLVLNVLIIALIAYASIFSISYYILDLRYFCAGIVQVVQKFKKIFVR